MPCRGRPRPSPTRGAAVPPPFIANKSNSLNSDISISSSCTPRGDCGEGSFDCPKTAGSTGSDTLGRIKRLGSSRVVAAAAAPCSCTASMPRAGRAGVLTGCAGVLRGCEGVLKSCSGVESGVRLKGSGDSACPPRGCFSALDRGGADRRALSLLLLPLHILGRVRFCRLMRSASKSISIVVQWREGTDSKGGAHKTAEESIAGPPMVGVRAFTAPLRR